MTNIPKRFCGYLIVDNITFAYNISDFCVTLLPAQSEAQDRLGALDEICMHGSTENQFFYGDYYGYPIALLCYDKLETDFFQIREYLEFASPLIIKGTGNTDDFFSQLTDGWEKFHAIAFVGGNINPVYYPDIAIANRDLNELLNNEGTREIKIRPFVDYTQSVDFKIDNEKVKLTISIGQFDNNSSSNENNAYNLGELNSFIRLSFEESKKFDQLKRYYAIIKNLVAILTKQNNVSFDVYLYQRNLKGKFYRTAECKICDKYENYSVKKSNKVIGISSVMECIPELIRKIDSGQALPLLRLLPEDNSKINKISITNVQDLCTALEVAYDWQERLREKDVCMDELKKNIKKTIGEFITNHPEIDPYSQSTINSAFKYLDYTLKQKILTLYSENREAVDTIINKWHLLAINEETVARFVKLRNMKTHSGIVEWGNCASLYSSLLALEYVCFFKYVGLPDNKIKQAIWKAF